MDEHENKSEHGTEAEYYSDAIFREAHGVNRRQAEALSDFADRRRESRQYEKLGRAVAKKVLYLVGACLLALWAHLDDRIGRILDWLLPR